MRKSAHITDNIYLVIVKIYLAPKQIAVKSIVLYNSVVDNKNIKTHEYHPLDINEWIANAVALLGFSPDISWIIN